MADPPRYPDPGAGVDRESRSGIPRWMQVLVGATVVVLVLLFVVVVVLVGGHTPPAGLH